MNYKTFITKIGFIPKENHSNIFIKKYLNEYFLEVDLEKNIIFWGGQIKIGDKEIQNITKPEDWVVLECVNRLLEKGYKAKDIILEKVFPSGHGHSGRLDIFVEKEGKAFLMIECKTWGKEFEKEFSNIQKHGGQLFTYFQNDKNAEFLMLYTSQFDEKNNCVEYKNEVVVIEESYKETANVKDLFERWNKFTKNNGVFDNWAIAYDFESRNLQMKDLKDIKQEDSSFIFNRFLEILRHNAVSDKSNAFTKIFTLFLCKVKDEDRNPDEELEFQWREGKDDPIEFQKRLSDLYKTAMKDFLDKEITDFSDIDFENKYGTLDEDTKKSLKEEFTKIRLQKNNEFAIKDVFNEETFLENNFVLKEVVELLQPYKFRYNKKQPFLGEFFELLLTTGLKQESGQFFTPVPVARFICKSVPLKQITEKKLQTGNSDLLPNIIDYAAGSGHFLTESMEELQNIISNISIDKYSPSVQRDLRKWEANPFDWAFDYVYGIERDYRLVRTTKVGCYLHGDGVAKVIHGDGLDSFSLSKKYKGKLKTENKDSQENGKFDFVLSNPPYSVSSFKGNTQNENFQNDFELYKNLTDQSSEIEALFIERTKQLLSEGGIAALILPASILSNTGIYTKAREIILKYFDIISIVELGSNTFMATGTSTVTLFLRRRNDYHWKKIQESIEKFFHDQKDKTVNGVENIFSKYVNHTFEDQEINFEDYQSLIAGHPNEKINKEDFFIEYQAKNKTLKQILETEKDKILYFILVYPQEIVLVNSGEKKEETQFLGYEFSNRRGSEGLHPINRSKSVDECTSLYDDKDFYNPEKASTYILEAFEDKPKREVSENLKKNISRIDLVDMLTFDRVDFEKTISTSAKKKIKIESNWEMVKLGEVTKLYQPKTITSAEITDSGLYSVFGANGEIGYFHQFNHEFSEVAITCRGATCGTINFTTPKSWITGNSMVSSPLDNRILKKYLFEILNYADLSPVITGTAQPQITRENLSPVKIPLPPLDIQQKIVDECEKVDSNVKNAEEKIEEGKNNIEKLFEELISASEKIVRLSDSNVFDVSIGNRVLKSEIKDKGVFPVYSANVFKPFGYIDKEFLTDFNSASVVWGIDGDWMVNVIPENTPFYPTDHCGYLRLKDPIIKEKYLAYVLNKKGLEENFSRVKRASIDKIKGIKIPFPSLQIQQKIVSEIEKIEDVISKNQEIINEARMKKEVILKKYL